MTSPLMPPRPTFSAPYDTDDKASVPSVPGGVAWPYKPYDDRVQDVPVRLLDDTPQEHRLCGCFAPLPAGYVICLFILAEGLFFGANLIWDPFSLGLPNKDPFHDAESAVLGVLSLGDIIMASLGVLGLLMTARVLPLSLVENQSSLATQCVGGLLPWRALVTLLAAPYMGFVLAGSDDMYRASWIVGTLIYIAVNAYILWALFSVLHMARRKSEFIQQQLDLQTQAAGPTARERDPFAAQYRAPAAGDPNLQIDVSGSGEEPSLFRCLPLELSVIVYILLVGVLSLCGFIFCLMTQKSFGGWAVIIPGAPSVGGTLYLEVVSYVFTFAMAVLALTAIAIHHGALNAGMDPEDAVAVRKRTHFSLMFYVVANILRFAIFIPITGMSLTAMDICSFWTHGVAYLASRRPFYQLSLVPMHCSPLDALALVCVLALVALDAYLVYGTLRFWREHREAFLRSSEKMRYAVEDGPPVYGYYGAAAGAKIA